NQGFNQNNTGYNNNSNFQNRNNQGFNQNNTGYNNNSNFQNRNNQGFNQNNTGYNNNSNFQNRNSQGFNQNNTGYNNNSNFQNRNSQGFNQNNIGYNNNSNFQNRNSQGFNQNSSGYNNNSNFQNRNNQGFNQNSSGYNNNSNFQNRNNQGFNQNNIGYNNNSNFQNRNSQNNSYNKSNNFNSNYLDKNNDKNSNTYNKSSGFSQNNIDYSFLGFDNQSSKNNENRNKNKSKDKYSEEIYVKTKRGIQKKISLYDAESHDIVSRAAKRKSKKSSYAASHQAMELEIQEEISIVDLARLINQRVKNLISEFKKFGFNYNQDSIIDFESAKIALEAMGHEVQLSENKNVDNIISGTNDSQENNKDLIIEYVKKPPVVVVMGHVDHGKTSLLDALRNSSIAEKEHGSITQHIGAYSINYKDELITFLDTPGHEAFTKIRSRGSNIANIAILVVAADDGIKMQTVEAINHIKAAKIPLIVAVNKIDKIDKYDHILNGLLQHNIVPESMGGDAIIVPISALKKINLDKLCEAILLLSEMLDIKYPKDAKNSGVIIESKIDKLKGITATALTQVGSLSVGDIIVAGNAYGKVRNLINDKGVKIQKADASIPVEIYGMNSIPTIGTNFLVVSNEKEAKEIIANYEQKTKTASYQLDTDLALKKLERGNVKDLNIIIRADVLSSVDAIESSILKISNDEIEVKIVHKGIGTVTDNDVLLAATTNAIIIGFNIKIPNSVQINAAQEKVKILNHYLIYSLIDDVKKIASGMMSFVITTNVLGSAEVRNIFNLTKEGLILGCYVTKGTIKRNMKARIIRKNIVLGNAKIDSIRRFKENVAEVNENFECGISISGFKDFELNDVIECYDETSTQKSL
ncbi:MAG: translation initiation factor IF-2, partial [Rickettsiales bacterium]